MIKLLSIQVLALLALFCTFEIQAAEVDKLEVKRMRTGLLQTF